MKLTRRDIELVDKAKSVAKKFSDIAKYNFKGERTSVCGAAARAKDGKVYLAPNIHHPDSGGVSICAEQIALAKAYSDGITSIDTVVAFFHGEGRKKVWSPCGKCREFMRLFGNPWVIVEKGGRLTKMKLSELLPVQVEWKPE